VRVDPDVRRLSLSVFLAGFVGPTPPGWLLDALADGLGGVVLFGSNLGDGTSVDKLTARLRAAAGRDIVIALDEEGGDVTRLDTVRGSASPGAAALGYLDDPDVTEQAYAMIGARLAEAGVTLDLAPVADVNVDPRNPVIGVRSFGSAPEVVARQVAAAVRGVQSAGVAACVKHFPGHGATTADSHHEVPTLRRSSAELEVVELPPFAAGIAAGARAVMTGHLIVPALDQKHLATVSPAITRDLLRDRLGFAGTVVTDAIEMRALAHTLGMAGGFVAALAAGADAVETGALDYPDLVTDIPNAVARALQSGELSLERLRDAAARTRELSAPRHACTSRGADDSAAARELAAPRHAYTSRGADKSVWARCVEVVGTLPRLVRPLVVEARPPDGMASGALPWSFASALAERVPDVQAAQVTTADPPVARDGGRTLVAVVRDPVRHPWQDALVAAADIVVDVGWPTELPRDVPLVRTRGVAPGLLAAAADILANA